VAILRTQAVLGNRTAWFWNDPVVRPFAGQYAGQLHNIIPLHLHLDDLHQEHWESLLTEATLKVLGEAAEVRRRAHEGPDTVDAATLAAAVAKLTEFPRKVAMVTGKLSDAHRDIGDDDGADFWAWWSSFQGFPQYDQGYWWFDNQMFRPDESYFRIPYAVIHLFVTGQLRRPAAGGPIGSPASWEPEALTDEERQRSLVTQAEAAERDADRDHNNRGLQVVAQRMRRTAMDFQPLRWDTTRPNEGETIERHGFHGRLCAETTLLAGWRLMTPNERDACRAGDLDHLDRSRDIE
jgi:hypothetical protein